MSKDDAPPGLAPSVSCVRYLAHRTQCMNSVQGHWGPHTRPCGPHTRPECPTLGSLITLGSPRQEPLLGSLRQQMCCPVHTLHELCAGALHIYTSCIVYGEQHWGA